MAERRATVLGVQMTRICAHPERAVALRFARRTAGSGFPSVMRLGRRRPLGLVMVTARRKHGDGLLAVVVGRVSWLAGYRSCLG
jgi:hypothetical protein